MMRLYKQNIKIIIFISLPLSLPQTIPLVVKQFKSAITRRINPKTTFFAWQPRFHDEIIKDKKRFFAARQYIKDNPKNWEKDEYNQ